MIQFSKLRLHGFKSFVDKTELEIGPGLTGIVGPNGCGKSNLVEALRWSMGENSSKRMRGGSGSMDDVIFNGTEKRPARNMAEVSVLLDNTKRTAPSPWNDCDEVEVVRRIEREEGSGYRINGKAVRARDVQILYADLLSGANSPFLISQGKTAAIINAKPLERKVILEEAAGISGLYARRHEAELRLRATENNLKRLEDLIGGMDGRLQALKKQARQAHKYRNLSAQIRQLEVMVACLEHRTAFEKLQDVQRRFGETESLVAEHMTVVSQLTKTHNTQSEDLPGLRHKDAELGAALQSYKLALQRLEDEAQRLEQQLEESNSQVSQARTDREHEKASLAENTNIIERLESEEKEILSRQDEEDNNLETRERARGALQTRVDDLESAFTTLMQQAAANRSRRQSLEQQIAQDQSRWETVKRRLSDVREQLAVKKADNEGDERTATLRADVETFETESETLRQTIETLQESVRDARTQREQLRQVLQGQENRKAKLEAEISTLESVVNMYAGDGFRPVLDDVQADEGFETALARALGDTLMASSDENAPAVWKIRAVDSSTLPALPSGVMVLAPHVKAPDALKLALSQIGVVNTADDADSFAAQLKPGQSLVSRDGAYWRWDGLHVKATAADRNAVQLKQKNRLLELQKQLPALDESVQAAATALQTAENELSAVQNRFDATQTQRQDTEKKAREKRIALNESITAQAARQAELAKLEEVLVLAEADLKSLDEAIAENRGELAGFDDATLESHQKKAEESRETLAAAREELQSAISAWEASRQDVARRKARLHAIADERVNLQNRCIRARERIRELDEREEQLGAKIDDLKQRPETIRKDSETLLEKIGALESEKGSVSDHLAQLESELAETNKALKQAEAALAEAREARAHAMATTAERQQQMETIVQHIRESFDMTPEDLSVQAALDPENLPDLDGLKQQKEKAVRDRDGIGPVNLRADVEAEELEKELTTILSEKNDLSEAINELRQGIMKLNREARERLQTAFERVNAHFQEMFTRLFNGGNAHLKLIESDDPLEAGLEIYAQPPGKALQSLSLLSGGEQTMTAMALIFAMFLTNPAPICVLDEVDAPLDDANVDRFCDVLDEFAERNETRFLLITHHRLTMARMDRLYGVTMSEKGVSQLVSVDMNQQLDFLEAAE